MKKLLKGDFRVLDLCFLLLPIYPLLKLNFSSLLFIIFCVLSLGYGLKDKTISFSKKNLKLFLLTTSYFFLLVISITYAEDKGKGVDWMVKLLPLFLTPIILIFFRPVFSEKLKIKALNIFLIANLIYILILFGFYIYYRNSPDLVRSYSGSFLSFDKIQFVLTEAINSYRLFIHKAYFSMGFVLCAVFSLYRANYYFDDNNRRSMLYFLLFLFFSFIVIYTFSFPNIIALIICVLVFITVEQWKKTLKIKKVILPFAILIGLSVLGLFYFSNDSDVKRGIHFINSVISQKEVEGNDPRIEIYKTYSNLLEKARPQEVLFGYGIGDEQKVLHREFENRIREKKNKNLIFFNEEFNDGYWFRNDVQVISNQIDAPNNEVTADLLRETAKTEVVSHNISTDLDLVKGEDYTFSVFAKMGTASTIVMRLGEIDNRAYFDLETAKVSKYSGLLSASIEPLERGWYRCSITVKGDGNALAVIGILGENGTYNYEGTGRDVYLWGAQIERRSSVSSYVKNGRELMEYAYAENLNSHNNYLFFLLNGGLLCLAAFMTSLFVLFYTSFKNLNTLQISFCIIIAFNFLTENILSRHWGLMFVAILTIVLYSATIKKNAKETI